MIGVRPFAARTSEALARAEASLERAQRMLTDHDARKPAGDDAEALFLWRRERRDIEDRVGASEEALAFSRQAAERTAAEAAEKAAAAAHAAEERAAKADIALVHKVDVLARKLAGARDELAASVARTEAFNNNLSSLQRVEDAERRVRAERPRTEPARFETRTVWRDAQGNTPGEWREHQGEMVPADHRTYEKREEQVQIQAERYVPGRMPTRYTDALVIVGLDGRPL